MRGVEPWHQRPWDWRAAVQFICGGMGTGLLFFTGLAALQDSAWLWRTGSLALALVGLGLFFVWIKLGRRLRALFVFLNPRTSWMSREAFLSVLVVTGGLASMGFGSPALGLIAALLALGYLYAQARILKESRGIPAWREPWIVPVIVATGLTEGAALLLIAMAVFGSGGVWLTAVLVLLTGARLWVWSRYRAALSVPTAAPLRTVEVLDNAHQTLVLVGHFLPLAAAAGAALLPGGEAILGIMAGAAALFGGWYMKFTIIARAAYNQGFAIARAPARAPGLAGPGSKPGWTTAPPHKAEATAPSSGDLSAVPER